MIIIYFVFLTDASEFFESFLTKDSDYSLVSSKNFSEILPPNGWHAGPDKEGQEGGLKVLHL